MAHVAPHDEEPRPGHSADAGNVRGAIAILRDRVIESKTRIADAAQPGDGFDFLGYHFERGMKWPRKKSKKKVRERIKSLTRRSNPCSMQAIIERVNPVLKGWFGYFKHSVPQTMKEIDSYTRGRLRSILRKRQHRRGRARGNDHQRWPNDLFHNLGLFSLAGARESIIQSSRR